MSSGTIFRSPRGAVPRMSFHRGLAVAAAMAVAALLLAFQQSGAAPASAQAQFPSEISGRVVNGTEGGKVPAGLRVVLLVVNEAQQIVEVKDTVVGTNGEFRFTGFLTGDGITYRVVADNGDHTPSVDLRVGRDSFQNVEITIWDRTGTFEDIRFTSYAMLVPSIDRAERLMGVLAVVQIENSGDRVWIPDLTQAVTGLDLLRFNLPEGYTDLSVETNLPPTANNFDQLLDIGTGFALTNPVPPGQYDVLMTYIVEYSGDRLDFPLRLAYGADEVRIMLPAGAGEITGMGLGAGEPVDIEGTPYTLVRGRNYAAGSALNVRFDSLPTPNFIESTRNFFEGRTYILVVAWIVAASLIGLLVYAFVFSRQRASAGGAAVADFPEYGKLQRAQIVETIAELDGRHEAGEIDDDDYRARRAALKKAALAARRTETQPT